MSIVVIPGGPETKITPDKFDELLASLNINDVSPGDKSDYLEVLRSYESVLNKVDATPDFIPPSLLPQPADSRTFYTPTEEENPFNAWSFRCRIAARVPASDILKGRTCAVKDNISVAGLPTTIGTSPYVFSEDGTWDLSSVDSTVVARILDAGGIVTGTSTCEAFCASPLSNTSFSGHVLNPRLVGHTAGGSSSGSAVLVAANSLKTSANVSAPNKNWGFTAELSIGSDQAGSVRIPASYNGIYGLKPTFGLVPYTGAASMSPMIDHLGPMAANLDDIAALLEVMAGYDGLDPRMTPESPLRESVKPYSQILASFRQEMANPTQIPFAKKWRVGILKESFQVVGLTDAVRDTVLEASTHFFTRAGAEVVQVSVPMHTDGPVIWNAATRPSMSTYLLKGRCSGHLTFQPPHIHPQPISQDIYEILNKNNPAAVNVLFSGTATGGLLDPSLEAKAHRLVFALRAAYDAALRQVDVLIAPCAPDVAKKLPVQYGDSSVMERISYPVGTTNNTAPFNVTGHPSLSVPCGFSNHPDSPDVSLPIGMQIIGKRFEDENVLMAAALFEMGKGLSES